MYFGQTIHPLNFAYAERVALTATGDAVEFSSTADHHLHHDGGENASPSSLARVRCRELAPWVVKLTVENGRVTDRRQDSDGLAPAWRDAGRTVVPSPAPGTGSEDGFVFAIAGFTVRATGAGLDLTWATGGRLTPTTSAATDRAHVATATGKPGPRQPLGGIGTNGCQTALHWDLGGATAALGFGERAGRLNKLGQGFDHHTVDVVAVHAHSWQRDDFDPGYVAIPLAILKLAGGAYVGLFFDNPERAVLDVGRRLAGVLMHQATDADTDLYLLAGPTLRDVTRHFAELTGRAELPPLWAIGHHQCRWGYRTEADFRALAARFAEYDIPTGAFWYDIDYMDGYRVFTWDRRNFPEPRRLNEDLKTQGIYTVAIVDPGVKHDPGYPVYDSGTAANAFCRAASGRPYVGSVWPGDTLFPDYTQAHARDWWAGLLARWLDESAVDGAWLDMNDPATGDTSPDEMRFDGGRVPHARFHNQYGHFMARASRAAFEKLDPRRRPFLLTRSGATGTQRHAAIWNGDNASNWQHLRMSIPCTLNLGLSGVAFNGPDVGGFMGNTTAELLTRWYQAGFLFPFFRNHSCEGTKNQEPWEFGPLVRGRIADVIRTRYRLLPYVYQLFWEHFLHGDPLLRPLCYEFDDPGLEHVDDQFLLGPHLLAAPMLRSLDEEHALLVDGRPVQFRAVTLPGGGSTGTWWFDLRRGEWLAGGQTLHYPVGLDESPLFVRDGAIIPYHGGPLANAHTDFRETVELHVFSRAAPAVGHYHLDDQRTRAYLLDGQHNRATFRAGRRDDGSGSGNGGWFFDVEETGPLPTGGTAWTPVFYGETPSLEEDSLGGATPLFVNGARRPAPLARGTRRWVGRDVSVLA